MTLQIPKECNSKARLPSQKETKNRPRVIAAPDASKQARATHGQVCAIKDLCTSPKGYKNTKCVTPTVYKRYSTAKKAHEEAERARSRSRSPRAKSPRAQSRSRSRSPVAVQKAQKAYQEAEKQLSKAKVAVDKAKKRVGDTVDRLAKVKATAAAK